LVLNFTVLAFAFGTNFATIPAGRLQMAKDEKISIALPPEMVGAVRDAVVSGEYASMSEVIRHALRDWTLKRKMAIVELDEMRRLVREEIESGPGIDADLVFSRLRAKFAGSTEE
jgi:antitoxin ParD1/3/4